MSRNKLIYILSFIVVLIGAFMGGYFFGNYSTPTARVSRQSLGYHQSYFSQPQFFDDAFQAASVTPLAPDPTVSGVLVNHHLLAPVFIAETLGIIASDEPTTVLLVSPNHFQVGAGDAISSVYDWETPYGILPVNIAAVNALKEKGAISIEESPFENEHGISGVIPFIKKVMPNASVVPIILKDKTTPDEIEALLNAITTTTKGRVVMVSSVDFSHYLPGPVGDFHDVLSKQVLRTMNEQYIDRLEVDSQPAIRLLLRYMHARDTEKFTLVNHSNSSIILQDPSITNGTSYITGYFAPGSRIVDTHATLFIPGTIQSSNTTDPSAMFTATARMFKGTHQTFIRLVGDTTSTILNNSTIRKGATDIQNNGVITIVTTEPRQIFTFLSLSAKTGSLEDVVQRVRLLPPHSAVVSVDWQGVVNAEQQRIAHALIDAGAVAVLGSNATGSVGPVEEYGQGIILYDTGDMVPPQSNDSTQSVAVGIDRTDKNITVTFFPMQFQNGRVSFLKPTEDDIVMEKLQLKQTDITINY